MTQKTPATKRAKKRAIPPVAPAKAVKKIGSPAIKKGNKLSARQLGKTVEDYIAELNGWQRECVDKLRRWIRESAPRSRESIKWGQPVYEYHGPFAWIKAHAHHVNCGFWRGAELPDPAGLLEGKGNKMRHIKFGSLKDLARRELQDLVHAAVELNEKLGNPTRSAMRKKI